MVRKVNKKQQLQQNGSCRPKLFSHLTKSKIATGFLTKVLRYLMMKQWHNKPVSSSQGGNTLLSYTNEVILVLIICEDTDKGHVHFKILDLYFHEVSNWILCTLISIVQKFPSHLVDRSVSNISETVILNSVGITPR